MTREAELAPGKAAGTAGDPDLRVQAIQTLGALLTLTLKYAFIMTSQLHVFKDGLNDSN